MTSFRIDRRNLLLGLATASAWAGPGRASGPGFRRGVNFHHMLNWPLTSRAEGRLTYSWPPFRTPQFQTSEVELATLRRAGFDFIRLTVDPSILIASDEGRRAALRVLLTNLVRRLHQADFSVIVDLHPVAVNPDFAPQALFDESRPAAFEAYRSIVGVVAGWLAPLTGERLIFELMNEPILVGEAGFRRWQAMLQALHDSARSQAPDLALMLTGANWSSLRALMRVDPAPFRGSNVYYTFHYYDPHSFTHQGVGKEHARFLTDLAWPASAETFDAAFQRAMARIDRETGLTGTEREQAIATTRKLIQDNILTGHDAHRAAADFEALAGWARQNAIPESRIILGEFGSVRPPDQPRARAAATQWLATIRNLAERHGFPWAFWAYKGYGGMTLTADVPNAALDGEQLQALGLAPG